MYSFCWVCGWPCMRVRCQKSNSRCWRHRWHWRFQTVLWKIQCPPPYHRTSHLPYFLHDCLCQLEKILFGEVDKWTDTWYFQNNVTSLSIDFSITSAQLNVRNDFFFVLLIVEIIIWNKFWHGKTLRLMVKVVKLSLSCIFFVQACKLNCNKIKLS